MSMSDAARDPGAVAREECLLSSTWTRDPQTGRPIARWTACGAQSDAKFYLPADAYPLGARAARRPRRSGAETAVDIAFVWLLILGAATGALIFSSSLGSADGGIAFDVICGGAIGVVVSGLLAWPLRRRINQHWIAPAAERVTAPAPLTVQAAADAANPAV